MNHELFGIIAGVVSAIAFIPYILSILRGKTKPNRATWAIWTIVAVIICFSYRSTTDSHEAWWCTVSYAVGCFIVFLLSFKRGVGGFELLDLICLIGAILGALLWWIFNSPLTALVMNLAMDFLGLIPTLKKSWKTPKEEDLLGWTLSTIGGVLNLFAVTEWDSLSNFIYPVYVAVGIGSVWVILVIRRLQKIQ